MQQDAEGTQNILGQLRDAGGLGGLNISKGGQKYEQVDIPGSIKWPVGVKPPRNLKDSVKTDGDNKLMNRALSYYKSSMQYRLLGPLIGDFIQMITPQNLRMTSQNRLFVPKSVIQAYWDKAQSKDSTLTDAQRYYAAQGMKYARNLINMYQLLYTTQTGFQNKQDYYGSTATKARNKLQQLRHKVQQTVKDYTLDAGTYSTNSTNDFNTYKSTPTSQNYKKLMQSLGAATTKTYVTSDKLAVDVKDAASKADLQD